jgi:hypothetical protein
MSIKNSLVQVLAAPTPASLWQLRGDILQAGVPLEAPLWSTLDQFFEFLNTLSAALSAREYSQLATMLDIGAVGGVALESIFDSNLDEADYWKRLLTGTLSESLMILASRQYVKAFQAETKTVYRAAAWHLQAELWRVSTRAQPELNLTERRQMIDELFAPVMDENVGEPLKALLIGRLFLVMLLIQLSLSLSHNAGEASPE